MSVVKAGFDKKANFIVRNLATELRRQQLGINFPNLVESSPSSSKRTTNPTLKLASRKLNRLNFKVR